jgi:hypothetical protein
VIFKEEEMATETNVPQDGIECPRCGDFSPLDAIECYKCHLNFYPQDSDETKANTESWASERDNNKISQQNTHSIPLGSKIVSIAATLALIGFFLPWVLVSCNGQPMVTMTGYQITTGGRIPTTYGLSDPLPAVPILIGTLGASALVLLLFITHYIIRRLGIIISIFQVVLGFLGAGSMILAWKKFLALYAGEGEYFFMPVSMTVQSLYGAWITTIGIAGIIIGGILSIADFLRRGKRPMNQLISNQEKTPSNTGST